MSLPYADIYSRLGVGNDADESAIKRAYAALIKQYRPDSHPAEFAQIRAAYEEAVQRCRQRQQWEAWDYDEGQQSETVLPDPLPAEAKEHRLPEPAASIAPFSHDSASTGEQPQPADVAPKRRASHVITIPAELDDGQPVADAPVHSIADLIAEFEDHGEASEEDMLQRYHAHVAMLAVMPLDQQMDYEMALCHWLLFSENPPLLVFREANLRYGWAGNTAEIAREYGSLAAKRTTAMQELAERYAKLRDVRGPYLSLNGEASSGSSRLAWHYSVMQAKQQATLWELECGNAGLPLFAQRVTYAPGRAFQVFWLDVAIGAFAAWLEWLPGDAGILGICRAILLGLFLVFLPSLLRRAFAYSAPAFKRATGRCVSWRERVFRALPPWVGSSVLWTRALLIVGGVAAVMIAFGLAPTPALMGLGVVVVLVAAVFGYAALAVLEIAVSSAAVKTARLPAWVAGLPAARKRTGSWRAALGWDAQWARMKSGMSFRGIPWWGWMVAVQIALAIAREMKN